MLLREIIFNYRNMITNQMYYYTENIIIMFKLHFLECNSLEKSLQGTFPLRLKKKNKNV